MYSNLRVKTPGGSEVYAWKVEIEKEQVVVHLDANDGQSSYAVEDGTMTLGIKGPVTITASF